MGPLAHKLMGIVLAVAGTYLVILLVLWTMWGLLAYDLVIVRKG